MGHNAPPPPVKEVIGTEHFTEAQWKQIDKIVDNLECSLEEAIEIYKADKAIDKGEKVDFDLSEEDHKQAMKMANVNEHKVVKKATRTKKIDDEKQEIIAETAEFLKKFTENIQISNIDREIKMVVGENRYTFTLIKNRK